MLEAVLETVRTGVRGQRDENNDDEGSEPWRHKKVPFM